MLVWVRSRYSRDRMVLSESDYYGEENGFHRSKRRSLQMVFLEKRDFYMKACFERLKIIIVYF